MKVEFIAPDMSYFDAYWEMFDTIAREGKYLAQMQAFPKDSTKMFLQHCIDEHVPYLFAIDRADDKLIGWCDAQMCGAGICRLGVGLLKAYRECGLGTKLISQVLELAKTQGFKLVELDVRVSNTRAIHVYGKLGFKATKVRSNLPEFSQVDEPILRMEKVLY